MCYWGLARRRMMSHVRKLSRRDFLRLAAAAATGALLAACAPAARETAQAVEDAQAEPAATKVPTVVESPPTATPAPTEALPAAVPPTATAVEEAVDTFIAKVADVPPGSAFDFEWNGKPAIVVNFEGEYRAYRNVCPHNGCPTKYYGGDNLSCPCHNSSFKVDNGDVIQGPATSPLRSIEVVVDGDSIRVAV
jgi:nitrite reductase/ring-hydroxylating ferredoxin subunit